MGPRHDLEAVHIVLRYGWAWRRGIQSVIEKERQLNSNASDVGRRIFEDDTIQRWSKQDEPAETVVTDILVRLAEAGKR